MQKVLKAEDFGDFAVNVSSLARFSKMAPPAIAQAVATEIKIDDCEINTVAGFINFKLGNSYLNTIVQDVLNEKLNTAQMLSEKDKESYSNMYRQTRQDLFI